MRQTSHVEPFPERTALLFALVAVAARLYFWLYTGRVWEDALITLQHAENAARGLGLTHTPQAGPPLHGFTSPLGVLIPLLGEWLHPGLGLPFLKLLSALFGGVSVWLGMRIAYRLGLARAFVLLVGGFLAIEHQQILFGMAGMETQIVVTVLLFSFYTLLDRNPKMVGLGLGLSMLARPDFVFWVAIVLVLLGWRCWQTRQLKPLLIVLAGILLLYGPWLAFTTWYYGSPVPNTILAKAYGYRNDWYNNISRRHIPEQILLRLRYFLFGSLGPAYAGNGSGRQSFGDGGAIAYFWLLLTVPGCVRAWRRGDAASLGICAFVIVFSLYYMFAMAFPFGWYVVPLAAATILASVSGADLLLRSRLRPSLLKPISYGLTIAYLTIHATLMPVTFRGDRHIQEFVENRHRRVIGEYLAGITNPGQTIGCEPLGYLGYYSRRVIYDYPGLCNRKVVQFMRDQRGVRSMQGMLTALAPDYLVLRPYEIASKDGGGDWLRDYGLIREFRVPEAEIRQLLFPEGNVDLVFSVYKRRSPPAREESTR